MEDVAFEGDGNGSEAKLGEVVRFGEGGGVKFFQAGLFGTIVNAN